MMQIPIASFSILFWNKKWLWLVSLLPLLFISDILYGGLDYYSIKLPISPGLLFRGGVLLAAIYMMIAYHHIVDKKLMIWTILMIVSTVPSIIVGTSDSEGLLFDLIALFKVLYLPFVTCLFVVLILRFHIQYDEILRFIEYVAYLLGITLLVSQILGIQRESYGDYAFGSKGIFYAGNDVTLALGLSLIAATFRVTFIHFSWIRLICLVTSAIACVQIGARASLAIVIGVAIFTVICGAWGHFPSRNNQIIKRIRKWIISIFILVIMLGALFYGLSKQQEFNFQQQKLEQIIDGDLPRLLLIQAGQRYIIERSDWLHLTGEGANSFQKNISEYFLGNQGRKSIEVDWMDIFGGYGIVFTLLIHTFVLLVLLGSTWQFLIKHDALYGLVATSTLLYLSHSIFAGHALTSPIPTTLMAAYFSFIFTKNRTANLATTRKV